MIPGFILAARPRYLSSEAAELGTKWSYGSAFCTESVSKPVGLWSVAENADWWGPKNPTKLCKLGTSGASPILVDQWLIVAESCFPIAPSHLTDTGFRTTVG